MSAETDPAGELETAVDDVDDRDVPADAGHHGVLVTARCIGCKVVRFKRAPPETVEGDRRGSFKHVCHAEECRGATWWNVLAVRGGEA